MNAASADRAWPWRYIAVVLAHAGDLGTFVLGVRLLGIAAEVNPVMRGAYAVDPVLTVLLKVFGVVVMCLIISRLPRPLRGLGTSMAVAFGCVGMVGNVIAIL